MKQYYQMGSDETRMQINGSLESLSSEQVREHQKKYGPNELQEEKKKLQKEITDIKQSKAYRLGNKLMWLPRKIVKRG